MSFSRVFFLAIAGILLSNLAISQDVITIEANKPATIKVVPKIGSFNQEQVLDEFEWRLNAIKLRVEEMEFFLLESSKSSKLLAPNPQSDNSIKLKSEPAVGGLFDPIWTRSKERQFLRKFCEILDCKDCELSRAEKRKVKFAVVFSPKARAEARELMADAYATADLETRLASTGTTRGPPVKFENIDWENFDWEAAKEFWVEIIKTIATLIKLFVVHEKNRRAAERLVRSKRRSRTWPGSRLA